MLKALFTKVKSAPTRPMILTMYDTNAELKLSADASAHSLGAVLYRRSVHLPHESWSSMHLILSLRQIKATIEKETSSNWACERFNEYILGKLVLEELGTKSLSKLPPHILMFCI